MTLPLDPVIAHVLTVLPAFDPPNLTPKSCRDMLRGLAAARNDLPLPEVASVQDLRIPSGPPVRIYRPAATSVPTVVFFHGGGWVAGDLETHERQCRSMASDIGVVVVSVDYRRPPEAPFPAAFDDALLATRWAIDNVATLGGDAARVAVAGDSAGGNLAAATAIACRDLGLKLAAQLLVYPVTDVAGGFRDQVVNAKYPSRAQNADGYFLTLDTMRWFADHYLPDHSKQADPRVSPLRAANLTGVAPAVVTSAHFDPLRDEGIAYAAALRAAGVTVREHRGAGLIHGYFGMGGAVPAAADEVNRVRGDFRALLG